MSEWAPGVREPNESTSQTHNSIIGYVLLTVYVFICIIGVWFRE